MSVVFLVDKVTKWTQENICDKIMLKSPPRDEDAPTDADYDYQLVVPQAFPMYVPTSEKLPPKIRSPFPSVCVRFTAGEDNAAAERGFLDMQLCFATWDTGIHGEDILLPNGDNTFRQWTGEEADAFFKRTGGGWRDAWNFVDIGLRALESVTHIDGLAIDRATPIKFGPLTEQESIPDLYPTWFAWISFRVNYPLVRNIQDFNNLL